MTETLTSLMEALKEEEETDLPERARYAAQRMVSARTSDLQQRILLSRARREGEAHRRSDSQEGAALD